MSLTLVYVANGVPVEEKERQKIETLVAQPTAPFWLDLISPSEDELEWLAHTFDFHPLTLEDLRGENPRPKLEDYPEYIFLVAHSAVIELGRVELEEIHVFVSGSYFITSHSERLQSHVEFRHKLEDRAQWLSRGTDFCLYRLLDDLADGYLTVVNDLDDELDELQDAIVMQSLRDVGPITRVRRDLATLRRIIGPTRELTSELGLRAYSFIRAENSVYFRDLHNLLVTIFDMTETQRDVAAGILDAHLSAISNRLNEVVKRLTVVATIFLPMSFIASVGGMNFTMMPFDDPLFLAATIAVLIIIPIAMLAWFRREGWY